MSQTEKTLHFLDLDWTITAMRFFGKRSCRWIDQILTEDADHSAQFTVSVGEAENLIRLLQRAIAQAYEWERSEPAATDKKTHDLRCNLKWDSKPGCAGAFIRESEAE